MIPLTPLVSHVGEPFNRQVFEPQPGTVRLNVRAFYCLETALLMQKVLTLVTGLEPASLPLNEAPVDSGF